jgi:hypothetical protein
MFVKWLCWLISLIYIHLLSEIIMSGKAEKCAGDAVVGRQSKKCRKVNNVRAET